MKRASTPDKDRSPCSNPSAGSPSSAGGSPAWSPSPPAPRALISLRHRNEAQLQSFIAKVSDPSSAGYEHYLTAAQFTARYAPSTSTVQAVQSFARSYGLTVQSVPSNRAYVYVTGSVAQMERAFAATIDSYVLGARRCRRRRSARAPRGRSPPRHGDRGAGARAWPPRRPARMARPLFRTSCRATQRSSCRAPTTPTPELALRDRGREYHACRRAQQRLRIRYLLGHRHSDPDQRGVGSLELSVGWRRRHQSGVCRAALSVIGRPRPPWRRLAGQRQRAERRHRSRTCCPRLAMLGDPTSGFLMGQTEDFSAYANPSATTSRATR